jgi:hypothetical protein
MTLRLAAKAPCPASNLVLGEDRAYSRDGGTPGWEALEEIVVGFEDGSSVFFASGMAGIAAIFDQLPYLQARSWPRRISLAFQSVAPRDYFEFASDSVLDADHRVHRKYKCGEHGAELVNR